MQGNFSSAIHCYEKSLEITKLTGEIDLERVNKYNLGLIYYDSNPELACQYFKESIKLYEMISGKLVEEEFKIGYITRSIDAYQCLIPLCLKLNKVQEAYEYIERNKSRVLFDLLATTRIKPSVQVTAQLKSLLDVEENYLTRLRYIQNRHLRKEKIQVQLGEVEAMLQNLNGVYDQIEKVDPDYVSLRRVKPISLNDLCKALVLE